MSKLHKMSENRGGQLSPESLLVGGAAMSGAQGGMRSRASAQDRGGTGVVPSAIGRLSLVAITLGLVIPARAAYVVWYGNGSAPFYWDDTEN